MLDRQYYSLYVRYVWDKYITFGALLTKTVLPHCHILFSDSRVESIETFVTNNNYRVVYNVIVK